MPAFSTPATVDGELLRLIVPVLVTDASKVESDSAGGEKETFKFRGLIDTGATISCVTEELVKTLKLWPTGQRTMATASHIVETSIYRVIITIAADLPGQVTEESNLEDTKPWPMSNPSVVEASTFARVVGEDADVLIGMDIIQKSVLIYNGSDNRLTMAF